MKSGSRRQDLRNEPIDTCVPALPGFSMFSSGRLTGTGNNFFTHHLMGDNPDRIAARFEKLAGCRARFFRHRYGRF